MGDISKYPGSLLEIGGRADQDGDDGGGKRGERKVHCTPATVKILAATPDTQSEQQTHV